MAVILGPNLVSGQVCRTINAVAYCKWWGFWNHGEVSKMHCSPSMWLGPWHFHCFALNCDWWSSSSVGSSSISYWRGIQWKATWPFWADFRWPIYFLQIRSTSCRFFFFYIPSKQLYFQMQFNHCTKASMFLTMILYR